MFREFTLKYTYISVSIQYENSHLKAFQNIRKFSTRKYNIGTSYVYLYFRIRGRKGNLNNLSYDSHINNFHQKLFKQP